jgi:16S rRNA (cytidine1402-2'-O)-methyltransferase
LENDVSIDPGILYVVATPIGNLEDISYRAVSVLRQVDLIAVEDTRHSAKLLNRYAIDAARISLHEHNEQRRTQGILARLESGESVALISDAGTPLISDPGYRLVAAVRAAGLRVSPVPGACAAIAALSAGGLPTDRFVFEGFLSAKESTRRSRLKVLAEETRTLVFYESSHRILSTLQDLTTCLGEDRPAVIARELTKTFETLKSAGLKMLGEWLREDPNRQRGEFVVLVKGIEASRQNISTRELERLLSLLLDELPLKTAVRLVAKITAEKKNRIYSIALALKKGG